MANVIAPLAKKGGGLQCGFMAQSYANGNPLEVDPNPPCEHSDIAPVKLDVQYIRCTAFSDNSC